MKFIITSGAMETKIDNVRNIINTSTGKLGSVFANTLMQKGYNDIVYIHTSSAVLPENKNIKLIKINNNEEVLNELKNNIDDNTVVIHLMAISDFKYNGSMSINEFLNEVLKYKGELETKEDIFNLFNKNLNKENKLNSKDDQLLYLSKDIKVIDQIKKINPNVRLVGFKLLSGVDQNEIIKVAKALKDRTSSDMVVGNVKEDIDENKHKAYIIDNNSIKKVNTKEEIVAEVLNKLNI